LVGFGVTQGCHGAFLFQTLQRFSSDIELNVLNQIDSGKR
jgi:hypothetical protein